MRLAWGGRLGGGPTREKPAGGGGPGREIGEAPGKETEGAAEGTEAGKGGVTKGGGLVPARMGIPPDGGPEGRLICRFCMLSANELGMFWLLGLIFGGV